MRRPAKPKTKEISLHMQVAGFLRYAWPGDCVFFHVPNGEKRDPRTAAKIKAMGGLAGVPDFVFLLPNGQAGFIELKVSDGALSPSQIEFRQKAMALNCGFAVCRSLDEVEATLTRWLAMFGRKLNATTRSAA